MLATGQQTFALPSVDRVGDVVGVQFPHEDEVVLYIPGSGDVLLCSGDQWSRLKAMSAADIPDTLTYPLDGNSGAQAGCSGDLKSTLLGLGACLG